MNSPSVPKQRLLATAGKIRTLLDEVYDTSQIFDFREICQRYIECFEVDLNFLFYIKERKWFSESRPQRDPFLKFNYLSFESQKGILRFFDSPYDLEKREVELEGEGYERHLSRSTVIVVKPDEIAHIDFEPIENLTKRLFVAFFRNCGSFDHFRESVSLRFAREMHKSVVHVTEDTVTEFVRDRLNLDLQIFHQKDEIFFKESASFEELIREPARAKRLPDHLIADSSFNSAFRVSVLRKNKTFGRSSNGEYRFAIVTHTEEYFVNNEAIGHRTIKQRPRLCLVFYRRGGLLDLEAVHHATRIVSLFLHFSDIHDRESLMSIHSERILEIEENLAESPVETQGELLSIVNSEIEEVLNYAIRVSDAEGYCLYEYRSITNSLVPVMMSGDEADRAEIELASEKAHAKVFQKTTPMDVWHPDKLDHDLDEIASRSWSGSMEKREIAERWLAQSMDLAHASSLGRRAAWICPVIKGRIPIGVIEFYSTTVSRLSPSIPLLQAATNLIGEVFLRAELANDRGWLGRLSFIQVARHRIENAIDQVHRISPDLADKLRSSFKEPIDWTQVNEAAGQTTPLAVIERIALQVEHQIPGFAFPSTFWRRFAILKKYEPLSQSVVGAVADIIVELTSNRTTPFQPDRDEITVGAEESDIPFLLLKYTPLGVNIPIEVARKLCTSPYKRRGSPTYHYGLFLCGTQTRMIGGRASVPMQAPTSPKSTPFGVTFQIPLRTIGSQNGSNASSSSD